MPKKSHIWETKHLSTDADSSTAAKKLLSILFFFIPPRRHRRRQGAFTPKKIKIKNTPTPPDRQTDIATLWKHQPRGPMLWKFKLNKKKLKIISSEYLKYILNLSRPTITNWITSRPQKNCQTPDQTKKNQIKPKIWRGSIIAWFLSFFLSFFLPFLFGRHAQNSSDVTLSLEDAD